MELIDILKQSVAKHGYVDVGKGAREVLGVTYRELSNTLGALVSQGYGVFFVQINQQNTNRTRIVKILTNPGASYSDAFKNRALVRPVMTPDECYDKSGNAYPHGRCDTCGEPCDEGGCTLDREHKTAVE